ncbi:MAG: PD40 domain-containing protein [Planctomycetes bacterium]|nr:PD40 domain-containing protein [Planctomycetota bacterium]MBL7041951.1 PD40 domain-containing protein [Pirellulaceae bacterium]
MSDVKTCPHCGTRVSPTADGICPACRATGLMQTEASGPEQGALGASINGRESRTGSSLPGVSTAKVSWFTRLFRGDEGNAWSKACQRNTPRAYRKFLSRFLDSSHTPTARNALDELEWTHARQSLYELDGQAFNPNAFVHLEPDQVRRGSRVPLREEKGTLGAGFCLCTDDFGVIYAWRQGRLSWIIVNASYHTQFLGVGSGNPESALIRAGYRACIRCGDETVFGADASPNHSVQVKRKKGRFIELCYLSKDVDTIVEGYERFSRDHYGPTVEFVPAGLLDMPDIDDSPRVQSEAANCAHISPYCLAKAYHIRLKPLTPEHRVLKFRLRCLICETESDPQPITVPSEVGTTVLGESSFMCGCESMFRASARGLGISDDGLRLLLVAELFAHPRDAVVTQQNVEAVVLRVESLDAEERVTPVSTKRPALPQPEPARPIQPTAQQASYRVVTEALGRLHTRILASAFSSDGCRLAYVTYGSRGVRVVVDGQKGPEYDSIGQGTLVFSPDGSRVAYTAWKGKRQVLVVDGQEGPEYDGVSASGFSSDGKRVAYTAWKGKKRVAVINDQQGAEYDAIGEGMPIFSPNGKRVAYVAGRGDKWLVVVDGQEGPEYDGVSEGSPVFSPDGKHVGYGARKAEKWLVVVDGREGAEYDGIGKSEPVFSPDGKHVAYTARQGSKWLVVIDDQEGPEYVGIGKSTPLFSPDGKRLAYTAGTDGKRLVVVDGQPGAEYDAIGEGTPIFSPNGKRVAYVAGRGDKWLVVVDGQVGPEYDETGPPIISPDSRHIAYAAREGDKWLAVVDGQDGPKYDGVGEGSPVFSPDGKHVAYAAQKAKKWLVVVDGHESAQYDGVGSGERFFSPDGKHVAYEARKGNKQVVVVDGNEGPEYDVIIKNGPTFRGGGVVEYLAAKGGGLYRVKHVPVGQRV